MRGDFALHLQCEDVTRRRLKTTSENQGTIRIQGTVIYKAYVLLALATLFWAGNSIAGKWAVGHASPMILSSLRWMALAVLLYAFKRDQICADWNTIRQRLGYLLLMGTVGFTGFSVSLYYALVYTTAINASILQGSMPLFVFSASFILFGSAVTRAQALGFVCSFAGVIVIAARGDWHNLIALQINIGDALMFLAVMSYGIYTAALRIKPQLHWTSLMFILSLGASLSSLPMLAFEAVQGNTIWPDQLGWMVIVYIIIFPSLLSQVFYIRAVELIGGNRAGLFINLLPLWGALLAITVVKETFHPYHGMALAMIMLGIALAEYGSRKGARAA